MREIKFRAWDKYMELMHGVDRIQFDAQEIDVTVRKDEGFEEYYSITFSEIELMQYTGLKDKNGIEIYEGDIIRTTFPDCTAVVAWEQDTVRTIGYTIENERKIVYVDRVDRNDKSAVEVIGNIYENPELLEV